MRGSLTSIAISFIPILINRAVLSLKEAADFRNELTRHGIWDLGTTKFKPPPTIVSRLPDDPLETRPARDAEPMVTTTSCSTNSFTCIQTSTEFMMVPACEERTFPPYVEVGGSWQTTEIARTYWRCFPNAAIIMVSNYNFFGRAGSSLVLVHLKYN